ncbi:MAG: hypothetical protein COA38_02920 [Fluviicola sp.]|nr:MAG: hypothetical protein COA38_02920 [Fluviicola sp.]
MVKILIYIKEVNDVQARELMQLKNVMGLPLIEVKGRLKDQSRLVEYPLYYNDHEEIAEKVYGIVEILNSSEIEYSLHEVAEGMDFLKDEDLDGWIVDEDSLDDFLDF